jgi:hypothetical protein
MERDGARAAHTESLFRAVNERIAELTDGAPVNQAQFICECSDPACTEEIHLGLEEYDELRSEPTQFVVKPGHTEPTVERVVDETDGYKVVEKDAPGAAHVAADRDPRS